MASRFILSEDIEEQITFSRMVYGICPNNEHRCEFSYRSHRLATLHDLLQALQARESGGQQIEDVSSSLRWFATFFQLDQHCRSCGELLCKVAVSTAGLDPAGEEYQKCIRLNHLLALAGELQARDMLR